jgi:hypothetical protein
MWSRLVGLRDKKSGALGPCPWFHISGPKLPSTRIAYQIYLKKIKKINKWISFHFFFFAIVGSGTHSMQSWLGHGFLFPPRYFFPIRTVIPTTQNLLNPIWPSFYIFIYRQSPRIRTLKNALPLAPKRRRFSCPRKNTWTTYGGFCGLEINNRRWFLVWG